MAVSPLGGSETRLGATYSVAIPAFFAGAQIAWSPDGKWLCFADSNGTDESQGLFILSLETGEKRRLTTVPSESFRDRGPAFSPDGKWVAFCRVATYGVSDVYAQALSPGYMAVGRPLRLTSDSLNTTAVSWMPDSRHVVFSSGGFEADRALFTADVVKAADSHHAPAPVSVRTVVPAEDAFDVSVSRDGRRAAYTKRLLDSNIWRVELAGTHAMSARRLIASTRSDQLPKVSPDGQRVAFSSGRSGTREIWVSDADGSNAVQLTSLGSRLTTNPAWSPDSQQVAFDSRRDGVANIFSVGVKGGVPRSLTGGLEQPTYPSWSHDGRWIYYHTGTGGTHYLFKVPSSGGEPVRVTRHTGNSAKESPEGKTLFFVRDNRLWRITQGGREELVFSEPVDEFNYDVTSKVVFFIPPPGAPSRMSIRFFNLETGQAGEVMRLEKAPCLGLSVSADERFLLYSQYDQEGSDLMLIDNFNPLQ